MSLTFSVGICLWHVSHVHEYERVAPISMMSPVTVVEILLQYHFAAQWR